jgi:hypothetical protein
MLILSIGLLMAVESAPSQTVGYFRMDITSDSWTPMSIPFGYTDLTVTNVIGNQFNDLDMIQDMATGLNTVYYDGFGWYGDLAELAYGSAYWVNRTADNPDMSYYIMGTVDPHAVTVHVVAEGWTAFALNEAKPVDVTTLPIPGALDLDMIQDAGTGLNSVYYDGFGWYGDLTNLEPTHAYWYNTAATSDFEWTYTPGARSSAVAHRSGKPVNVDTFRTKK